MKPYRNILLAGAVVTAMLITGPVTATQSQSEEVDAAPAAIGAVSPVAHGGERSGWNPDRLAPPDEHGRYLYIVRFSEPSLAAYGGGIQGLAATSPRATGQRRIDFESDEVRAYLQFLERQQATYLDDIAALTGRNASPEHRFLNVLNAVSLRLTHAEAEAVSRLDFVRSATPDELHEIDTDRGPELIGAPAIWDGQTTSGVGSRGEGMLIGIIDSGINPEHPSFAEVAEDGYVHENPFGPGVHVGICDPDDPDHQADFCNEKLVGAYALHPGTDDPGAGPGDNHGSHVASIAAGNPVEAVLQFGDDNIVTRDISGVAPRANLIHFQVCFPTCPTSASVEAVDLAIGHGVDALNYSISGSDNPWVNNIDLAFLDAFAANLFVSASAGNDGPGSSTVAKTGPWNASVGNSTHDRIFANGVDAAGLTDIAVLQGTGPLLEETLSGPIIDVAADFPANEFGCDPYPAGSLDGAIPLISRGDCTFALKIDNAHAAGAIAVLVFNNTGGPPIVMGGAEDTQIPSAMMDILSGQALQDAIAGTTDPQATFYPDVDAFFEPAWQDIVANLSSRGPSQFDILKPDFTAPGSNILAAYGPDAEGNPFHFGTTGGTSMASPHAVGSGAILMAVHPDWSPAMIKSAMAMTADQQVLDTDGVTPADFFDMGAGRLDLARAGLAGFVLDETHANYVDANPDIGGDPRTLNQPYMMDRECAESCSWERSITSVLPDDQDWEVSFQGPPDLSVTVVPDSFTLAAGADLTLEVSADVADLPIDEWVFAQLVFQPIGGEQQIPELVMPIIVRPVEPAEGAQIALVPPAFDVELLADQVSAETLTIVNDGTKALEWEISGVVGGTRTGVLWQQQQSASTGIVSTFFEDQDGGTGAYSTDDFILAADASLSTILVEGFLGQNGSFDNVTSIHWMLFPDDDGEPAGNPEDSPELAVWDFSTAPDAAGVDLTDENIRLDLETATGQRLDLDAGHYWLVVYLSQPGEVSGDRWNWFAGGPEQLELPKIITPGSAFGGAYPQWTDLTQINEVFTGLAFTLTGTIDCEAGFPQWLDASPTSGTVAAQDSEAVSLQFDTGGLAPGDYQAQLCIESNADNAPFSIVPVNLTVLDQPQAQISPDEFEFQVASGDSTSDLMAIANTGTADLLWNALEPLEGAFRGNGGILYESGPLVTHPGEGPGGTDHSVLQNSTLGMTTLGSNVSRPNFRVADRFEIQDGSWVIDSMSFFVYQTGSGTESTINHVNLLIWDGPPDDPDSQILFGDAETNRLIDTDWIEAYRVSETNVTQDRPIMEVVAGVDLFLPQGEYWVDVQFDGELASGPWMPPITITGELVTGEARFHGSGGWGPWLDGGSETQQGVAFIVRGAAGAGCYHPDEIDWLSLEATSGTVAPGDNQPVEVWADSAGLSPGVYETVLCIHTNDPQQTLVDLPVGLEVMDDPPVIEIAPTSLSATLFENETEVQAFNIANPGDGDLVWEIDQSLPGCDLPGWAGIAPQSGSLGSMQDEDVSVTFDSSGLAPGQYQALACVSSNDPDSPVVEVELELTVLDEMASLEGTVTSLGYCQDDPAPGASALVQVQGQQDLHTTVTDGDGHYQLSVPPGESPVDVTVSLANHRDDSVTGVELEAGQTTMLDFDLVLRAACATVAPEELSLVAVTGEQKSTQFTVGNELGGEALTWNLAGGDGCFDPDVDSWLTLPQVQGTVNWGDARDFGVEVDTQGLSPGVYSTVLCLETTDDNAAAFSIAVELVVAAPEIFHDRFESGE